jgi:hypothetical protein
MLIESAQANSSLMNSRYETTKTSKSNNNRFQQLHIARHLMNSSPVSSLFTHSASSSSLASSLSSKNENLVCNHINADIKSKPNSISITAITNENNHTNSLYDTNLDLALKASTAALKNSSIAATISRQSGSKSNMLKFIKNVPYLSQSHQNLNHATQYTLTKKSLFQPILKFKGQQDQLNQVKRSQIIYSHQADDIHKNDKDEEFEIANSIKFYKDTINLNIRNKQLPVNSNITITKSREDLSEYDNINPETNLNKSNVSKKQEPKDIEDGINISVNFTNPNFADKSNFNLIKNNMNDENSDNVNSKNNFHLKPAYGTINIYKSSFANNTIINRLNNSISQLKKMNEPNIRESIENKDNLPINSQICELRRQKSASTEQINLEGLRVNCNPILKQETALPNRLDPPPPIQPFSGVLSKNLFSVVLKPQPLKPKLSKTIKSSLFDSVSIGQSSTNIGLFFKNSKNLKKKCLSTTNIRSSSINCRKSVNQFQKQKSCCLNDKITFECSSSEAVNRPVQDFNYLVSNSRNSNDLSENSVHEVTNDCSKQLHHYENQLKSKIDIEDKEGHDTEQRKPKEESMLQMKNELKMRTDETFFLRNNLEHVIGKKNEMNINNDHTLEESEEERQVCEKKFRFNSIRAHLNQQLKLHGHKEKLIMLEKLNDLQILYNDLKINYSNDLENELKSLRMKLADSQDYALSLFKQLQKKSKYDKALSVATQTSQDSLNVTIENKTLNELFLYVKKLKFENNELKFQIDADRRSFQIEKEKWFNERLKFNLSH